MARKSSAKSVKSEPEVLIEEVIVESDLPVSQPVIRVIDDEVEIAIRKHIEATRKQASHL